MDKLKDMRCAQKNIGMMIKRADTDIILQLQQSIDDLTNALNTVWAEYNNTSATVKTMQYYIEVLLYLLIKENIVDGIEFMSSMEKTISDGENKNLENDTFVKYMEAIINKVNTATFNGTSGFMNKPDLGNV